MQRTSGLDHWHGSHPEKMGNPHPSSYPVWRERFALLSKDLAALGIVCENITRVTALIEFKQKKFEEFINE